MRSQEGTSCARICATSVFWGIHWLLVRVILLVDLIIGVLRWSAVVAQEVHSSPDCVDKTELVGFDDWMDFGPILIVFFQNVVDMPYLQCEMVFA